MEKGHHWYMLKVKGGREEGIKKELVALFSQRGVSNAEESILLPFEKAAVVNANAKKRTIKKRRYEPYILVRLVFGPELEDLIKSIKGVYGFLGDKGSDSLLPVPIPDSQVAQLLDGSFSTTEEDIYQIGDITTVKSGPFKGLKGKIVDKLENEKKLVLRIKMKGIEFDTKFKY